MRFQTADPTYRRVAMLAIDASSIVVAYWLAFWLRFDGRIPPEELGTLKLTLPWLVAIQMMLYFSSRLDRTIWRYVSFEDLLTIAAVAICGAFLLGGINAFVLKIEGFPRSLYILVPITQVVTLGGVRALRRIVHDRKSADQGKQVLVFGAGDAGEMIVRDMKHNPDYGYSPIGFIDDDPLKRGCSIHGVRVLGDRHDLYRIVDQEKPDEILIAMPRIDATTLRGVLKTLERCPTPVKTLPNINDIMNGRVTVSDMRSFSLGDLLGRATTGLDVRSVRTLIAGKRLLVTGAGGSIGSELCRQIWTLGPELLVMYERYENGLYTVEKELRDRGANGSVVGLIGDVCDQARTEAVLTDYQIEVVFHAAAHKHVPLMELNPCEAIKNNVKGTRILVEASARSRVERFILVSTDKAVNPGNVMGATKRIAEMIVQEVARQSGLKFAAVRFGNVLGSSGSVVPRFIEQIRAGGPVTVTHPAVTRFFMLIPEAVQLILHAASVSEPAALYVLEMGEQIRISEMAHHLIRLAGYVPGRDIKIEYTGLRPGEKLYEELVGEGEFAEPSAVDNVLLLRDNNVRDADWLRKHVLELERCAAEGRENDVMTFLRRIIPGFQARTSGSTDDPAPSAIAQNISTSEILAFEAAGK